MTENQQETRYIFLPALDAKTLSTIYKLCLPTEHLRSDKELQWFSQFDRQVISYFKSNEINDFLRIFFSNLKVAEDNEYLYNKNDILFIVTPKRQNIRIFADLEVVVIYKGLYEC